MSRSEYAVYQALRVAAVLCIIVGPILGVYLLFLAISEATNGGENAGGLIFFGISFLATAFLGLFRLRALNRNPPSKK